MPCEDFFTFVSESEVVLCFSSHQYKVTELAVHLEHLLLCLFMCNDRFGGVVCFHFYCNVIVFIQLEISDSTVSESPNVLVSPVLCFMPK